MFRKFKSLAHEKKYGYTFDSGAWDIHAPVDPHFLQYETCGDGLTQHSPQWSVQQEFLSDYLASLAQAMLTDDELAQALVFTFARRPSLKEIEFAASIKFKAPADDTGWNRKRKYFSIKQLKVSAAPSREHDKRFEEIRDVHDGSPNAIFRILVGEYSSGLEKESYRLRSATESLVENYRRQVAPKPAPEPEVAAHEEETGTPSAA